MSHMSLHDVFLSQQGYLYLGAGYGYGSASEELAHPPKRRPTMILVSPRLSSVPLRHLHPQLLLPRMY